jgi:hypothetical protein
VSTGRATRPTRSPSTAPISTIRLHEHLGETHLFTVPSDSVRTGTVNAAIKPYLDAYPPPNDGVSFGTTRGEYRRVGQRATDEQYVMGRIDHQLSAASQVFVRYTLDDAQVMTLPD